MPKVNFVQARKAYPQFGIDKGERHFVWTLKTGPRSSSTFRQKEQPKPWQLTSSPYLQQAYRLEHQAAEFSGDADDLGTMIDEIDTLRDEAQQSLDNMPESLQMGPTGELLEERTSMCDEALATLEDAKSDLEEALDEPDEPSRDDFDDGDDGDDEYETALDDYNNEVADKRGAADEAREQVHDLSLT